MKTEKKILVCYNAPVSYYSVYNGKPKTNPDEIDDMSESSFERELQIIVESLSNSFFEVDTFAVTSNIYSLIEKVNRYAPDVIFNFVESVEGVSSFESYIAGLYELLLVPYTGNKPQTLSNCLDKSKTKEILGSSGILIPGYQVFSSGKGITGDTFILNFPVITKLLNEDASIGISENSVTNNLTDLIKQVEFLTSTYNQNVLVEEYIDGREFNVAVLGDSTLPISEIDFSGLPSGLPKIVTYEGKWIADSIYYKHTNPSCPAKINKVLKNKIEKTALAAYKNLQCRDYARVDIRLNRDNTPYVIEVNPNPDISTDSGFFRAASAAGMDYKELLNRIANFAIKRGQRDSQAKVV